MNLLTKSKKLLDKLKRNKRFSRYPCEDYLHNALKLGECKRRSGVAIGRENKKASDSLEAFLYDCVNEGKEK